MALIQKRRESYPPACIAKKRNLYQAVERTGSRENNGNSFGLSGQDHQDTIIMHPDILKFISKQTCATISCVDEQANPYCFACFYAFHAEQVILYYKSSDDTRHSRLLRKNGKIAGTIHPDRLNKLFVQGVQFEGELLPEEHPQAQNAYVHYHKRHPYAIVKPGELWSVRIKHIKMTDSTKGFGTKLEWTRED
jgi:uncharacterized protein YhbP (UPF0306 family)